MKLEDIVRKAIRSQLVEANEVVVSLDAGNALKQRLQDAMVKRDAEQMKVATKEAIRQFRAGDRADQKLAHNLRAFQGSLKAGRGDWTIVELAFAEWRNRRKILTPVTEGVGHTKAENVKVGHVVNVMQGDTSWHNVTSVKIFQEEWGDKYNFSFDDGSSISLWGDEKVAIKEGRTNFSDDDIRKVVSLVKGGTPKDRVVNSLLGRKLGLTMGDVVSFMDMDEKGLLEHDWKRNDPDHCSKQVRTSKVVVKSAPKSEFNPTGRGWVVPARKGRCVLPKDHAGDCSLNKPNDGVTESKKTDLETIYESIEDFARRSQSDVFEVLDRMMLYCEVQGSHGPTSLPPDTFVIPPTDGPVKVSVDSDPTRSNGGPEGFRPPPPVGFEHQGAWIDDPLSVADAAGVQPDEHFGAAFMDSKFPFEFNGVWIVDPRYDETGTFEVPDAEKHFGDAFRGSDYFRRLR